MQNGQLSIVYSNNSDIENKLFLQKIEDNNQALREKSELLLPLLDVQKYAFIYKIDTNNNPLTFCIFANTDDRNAFFTDIPFIKFKAQQAKILYDLQHEDFFQESITTWSEAYSFNNIDSLHIGSKVKTNQRDINSLRKLLTNAIDLLELFQNGASDSVKTKNIEAIKKSSGSEFQLILDIAKTINNKIDEQVTPFLNMEKKYSSFLSDF